MTELSSAPSSVPVVKEIVRRLDYGDVAEDARKALTAESAADVHAIGAARLRAAGLEEHPDIGPWLAELLEDTVGPA